jgi:mono/diheme cytochrome c family protein
MIGRPDLSESDRIAVVDYIKTFSPRFATVKPAPSISVPPQPERTSALVIQGKELFHDAGCVSCHGEQAQLEPSVVDCLLPGIARTGGALALTGPLLG